VFILIIGLPLAVVNHLYKETNFYQEQLNNRARIRGLPEGTTLLTLGDSHEEAALAFDGIYRGEAHNLALGSQSPRYSYNLLQENADALAPGAVVLIPLSFFTFETDFPRNYRNASEKYNERYYALIKDKWHIVDYSLEDDLLYNYFSVLSAKENLHYLIDDTDDVTSANELSDNSVKDIDTVAKQKAESWIYDVMVDEGDSAYRKRTVKKNLQCYQEMIDFCHERGFKPVLLISPNTTQLIELLGTQRMEQFYEYTQTLCDANPDVLLLDHLQDERFTGNLDYFKDADHLNRRGAQVYTALIVQDLIDKGLLTEDMLIEPVAPEVSEMPRASGAKP
jgi:hypothetical protein